MSWVADRYETPKWLLRRHDARRVCCHPVGEPEFFGYHLTWGGTSERTYAVIEIENGYVRRCEATKIQFLDSLEPRTKAGE